MTEKFDSKFHRTYVGGTGEIVERNPVTRHTEYRTQTYEDVLEEYRWYMDDPEAELPEEIMEQLALMGKI